MGTTRGGEGDRGRGDLPCLTTSESVIEYLGGCGKICGVFVMPRIRYAKEEPREKCFVQQAEVCNHALECCAGGWQKLFCKSEAGTQHTVSNILVSVVCLPSATRI